MRPHDRWADGQSHRVQRRAASALPRLQVVRMTDRARVYAFGRFRLDTGARCVYADDSPVALSSRAFDILQLLIEHRDRVVAKDEIMESVWQGTFVDENNLAVQVSALRRALSGGDGAAQLIVTVPGRGYRFVGRIDEAEAAEPAKEPAPEPASQPPPASRPPVETAISPAADPPGKIRKLPVMAAALGAVVVLSMALVVGLWTGRIGPAPPVTAPQVQNPSAAPPPRLSIAVLPFRNFGDDAQENYLADALTDDLTTDLSHLPGSFVIARMSADVYKNRVVPADQIGRELGVRYLLEGSLRRVGDGLTINAQLIDTATGAHLWAERFDAQRQQLGETQTTIVRHIANALDFTLVQIESKRSLKDRPDNPDALDLFFRARSMLDRDDSYKGLTDAQALLEKAIALQPDFVDAMSELSWLLLRKVGDFDDPTDAQDMKAARALITRGIELAPRNPRMLTARGLLLKRDGRFQEAIDSYETALSFDPSDIDARTGLALCEVNLGHADKAEALIRAVLLIDPQDPENRVRYDQLGLIYLMLGRSEDAMEWLHKSAAGDPDPASPSDSLSRREWNEIGMIAAYGLSGRAAEARARYAEYARLWPHRTVWRLASYFTKAEAALPGLVAMLGALKDAGMPEFTDERLDAHVPPSPTPKIAGDFEMTAVSVPGARTIATPALAAMIHQGKPPLVVDVGSGAAVVPGASWVKESFPTDEGQAHLKTEVERAAGGDMDLPIVVMGNGIYDWNACNATLTLIGFGYRNVFWYRGGEEAWAAAGMAADDRRKP